MKTINDFLQEYEDLFSNRRAFRINCGPGWIPLLEETVEQLLEVQPGFEILQVKEKFGGLRIYIQPCSPQSQEILLETGRRSLSICEFTGKPGETEMLTGSAHTGPWLGSYYKTVCPEIRDEIQSFPNGIGDWREAYFEKYGVDPEEDSEIRRCLNTS